MRSTTAIYLQNQILGSPIDVLFTLLIFILSKNLNASPFQLMIMACIKPMTSLFAYYASTILHGRSSLIRPYLLVSMTLGILPCFFYPFVESIWFYIASYAIFKIARRTEGPAWIELLKRNRSLEEMGKTISRGTSVNYLIIMLLPPLLALWLGEHFWKWLFFMLAALQALNVVNVLLAKGAFAKTFDDSAIFTCLVKNPGKKKPFKELIEPLKRGMHLLYGHPQFAHYLFLYFLGGAGIVLMQPSLPIYFNQHLDLSYQQLTLAFSFCKGLSFLMSSPLWAKYISQISIYRLNAYMNMLTAFFIGGLLAAYGGVEWLYVAYLCYGAMQGGCELSWNLSGPIFAKANDSTAFSSLNLLLVGVRGCISPFLGYLLLTFGGVYAVFLFALAICLSGVAYGLWLDGRYGVNAAQVA
jgi:hypothetical protein